MARHDDVHEALRPPRWAQAMLRIILRAEDDEPVSGDLLEAYRDSVVPSVGRARANAWYLRQVLGFACRSAWIWALLLGVCLAGRTVFDTFAPPTRVAIGWGPRSAFTTYSSIAVYFGAGLWGGWRSGRTATGPFVACVAHVAAWIANGLCSTALYFGVIQQHERMLDLFEATGGWGELWGVPLMLLPIVLILGSAGGVLGAWTRRLTTFAFRCRS
jgi:hypothetical protein